MIPRLSRLALPVLVAGVLLVAIFAVMVMRFRAQLRAEIRQTIIDRAADVLRPVALRQLAQREAALTGRPAGAADLPAAVLESAQQEDMVAVVVFDARGRVLQVAPDALLFGDLPLDDYLQLLKGESISRYYPAFPLGRYFAGVGGPPDQQQTPVLEVLLPLHGRDATKILGFAQYYIDGHSLARELAAIDERINRQTAATLGSGALLIAAVILAVHFVLRRAQRTVAERNERLVRANFELALAAKTSALGQIVSHLIHGLQGPVAGLRAAVNGRGAEDAAPDWQTAASYTERIQTMVQETVALLSDASTRTSYELTGHELAEIIRRRNLPGAEKKGVVFRVEGGFAHVLDSHRGSLLCLITSNLVQNAVEATEAGRRVGVTLGNGGGRVTVTVADEGHGIPADLREHLFEPCRSGRAGGSGLGLAISRLLARQIDATLTLDATGPTGTSFSLTVPLGN